MSTPFARNSSSARRCNRQCRAMVVGWVTCGNVCVLCFSSTVARGPIPRPRPPCKTCQSILPRLAVAHRSAMRPLFKQLLQHMILLTCMGKLRQASLQPSLTLCLNGLQISARYGQATRHQAAVKRTSLLPLLWAKCPCRWAAAAKVVCIVILRRSSTGRHCASLFILLLMSAALQFCNHVKDTRRFACKAGDAHCSPAAGVQAGCQVTGAVLVQCGAWSSYLWASRGYSQMLMGCRVTAAMLVACAPHQQVSLAPA